MVASLELPGDQRVIDSLPCQLGTCDLAIDYVHNDGKKMYFSSKSAFQASMIEPKHFCGTLTLQVLDSTTMIAVRTRGNSTYSLAASVGLIALVPTVALMLNVQESNDQFGVIAAILVLCMVAMGVALSKQKALARKGMSVVTENLLKHLAS